MVSLSVSCEQGCGKCRILERSRLENGPLQVSGPAFPDALNLSPGFAVIFIRNMSVTCNISVCCIFPEKRTLSALEVVPFNGIHRHRVQICAYEGFIFNRTQGAMKNSLGAGVTD